LGDLADTQAFRADPNKALAPLARPELSTRDK